VAKYATLKSFYAGEAWQVFRLAVIATRGLRCEHCGKPVTKASELTLHHIIELTPENVRDVMISLNTENVLVVHHDCHNQMHQRFGYQPPKGTFIVYGPPLSGKTTYVREHKGRNDLVVDIDSLFAAVTMLPALDKPDQLLPNVMAVQRTLLDNIKVRYGRWHSAWVVGGYADRYRREQLADDLGAELIFCDVSLEECVRRLEIDETRRERRAEWRQYIERWFAEYMP
jgi:hypothetical protein